MYPSIASSPKLFGSIKWQRPLISACSRRFGVLNLSGGRRHWFDIAAYEDQRRQGLLFFPEMLCKVLKAAGKRESTFSGREQQPTLTRCKAHVNKSRTVLLLTNRHSQTTRQPRTGKNSHDERDGWPRKSWGSSMAHAKRRVWGLIVARRKLSVSGAPFRCDSEFTSES
jgi:hypothetical protein